MSAVNGPVHLIGIGGMHMSAIAQLLSEQGVAVHGSDLRPSDLTHRLEQRGIAIAYGPHEAANVGDARLVVRTAAAPDDNPEVVEARRRGLPVILRAEMVAKLMEGKRVIAVAGAHGKTTTSSMIAHILSRTGQKPMYLLGGESRDLGGNAAWGHGPLCVVEADEYKRAFLEYTPWTAIITNVEPDHLDYYGTAEAYEEAFIDFGRRVALGGMVLACSDDAGAMRVANRLESSGRSVARYGLLGSESFYASDIALGAVGVQFTYMMAGSPLGKVQVPIPGRHMVLNTVAAITACVSNSEVEFEAIAQAVADFHGARRRFELVGEAGGVTVMDDYAHHPTEVRATIAAARARFSPRRIFGVYQPHTYSRIAYLWDDWARCWDGLDGLVVLETYAAREEPLPGRSAADLAAAIASPAAVYAQDFDDAARKAAQLVRPGDVVFTIGAGDVDTVGPKLLELLR